MAHPGGVAALVGGALLVAAASVEVPPSGPPLAGARSVGTPLHRAAPPLAHTGGFDEPTCISCHFEFEANPEGGTMRVEGMPRRYRPGRTYDIRIEIEAEDMEAGGFQAALRFAAGARRGEQAGTMRARDARVVLRDSAGVQYAHHSAAGSSVTRPDRIEWVLEWVAPDAVDAVSLHLAANSANGDDSPLGDWVFVQEHRSVRR